MIADDLSTGTPVAITAPGCTKPFADAPGNNEEPGAACSRLFVAPTTTGVAVNRAFGFCSLPSSSTPRRGSLRHLGTVIKTLCFGTVNICNAFWKCDTEYAVGYIPSQAAFQVAASIVPVAAIPFLPCSDKTAALVALPK